MWVAPSTRGLLLDQLRDAMQRKRATPEFTSRVSEALVSLVYEAETRSEERRTELATRLVRALGQASLVRVQRVWDCAQRNPAPNTARAVFGEMLLSTWDLV